LQDKSITNTNVRVKIEPKDGKAVGIVEAPRGTLAHEYTLAKNGRLMDIMLMIPTQINNIAINTNLKDAAKEFIKNGEIKPGLLNRIEMIIRAYDPCIKCATRTVSNHLKVEVRDCHGKIVKF
jgi:coenzyme F420-reducing hydrogenase alpha subunit